MRPFGLMIAVVIGLSAMQNGKVSGQEPQRTQTQTVRYLTDLQAAHRISMRTNKPILLVFGADWCHFCKKLEGEAFVHPQIVHYVNQTFIPVHLDFDKSQREAKILGIESIPCVVALTPKAELIGRLDGYAEPQKVADMLTGATRLQTKIQQARYMQVDKPPIPGPARR